MCFDGVYITIPSMAHEADGSGSLDSFDVDVEIYGSVPTRRDTELCVRYKNRFGTTFWLRGEIPLTLTPDLLLQTDGDFP
jgi:hypothetical protein